MDGRGSSAYRKGWSWKAAYDAAMTRVRRVLPWLIGVLVVGLVIGGIAAVGGFKPRNYRIDVQPNVPIDVGPATLWIERAVVQRDSLNKEKWSVRVQMKCQLNVDDSLTGGGITYALTNHDAVQIGDMSTGTLIKGERPYLRIGPTGQNAALGKNDLSPGLPAQPCQFHFEMPTGYEPKDSLRMILFELEYRSSSYVSSTTFEDRTWLPGANFYRLDVPTEIQQ